MVIGLWGRLAVFLRLKAVVHKEFGYGNGRVRGPLGCVGLQSLGMEGYTRLDCAGEDAATVLAVSRTLSLRILVAYLSAERRSTWLIGWGGVVVLRDHAHPLEEM